MNNDIIIYAKKDEHNSIIRIVSNIFLDNTEGHEQIDQWQEGQDCYLYAHADNGEYVQTMHGKPLYDENGIPNFHDDFVEWTDEEKKEKYSSLYNAQLIVQQESMLQQMMARTQRVSFLVELPDEEAVKIPLCYDSWNSFSNGYTFKVDTRLEYNGNLWKVKKEHKKQVDWYPGADPTLFIQLDKDEHEGTLEDPIPVPDSVTTSGFEYVKGKYYLEDGLKYKMIRDGMKDGETITLYYPPSQLLTSYFELVNN